MTVVQVQATLPTDELLRAVGQLNQPDLEHFVYRVLALRASRQAPHLPRGEAELLLKINEEIPAKIQIRYNELIAKRQTESLEADEYNELLQLTQQVEKLEVRRVKYLAQLARLRQTSLTALMDNLGIQPPAYA